MSTIYRVKYYFVPTMRGFHHTEYMTAERLAYLREHDYCIYEARRVIATCAGKQIEINLK